MTRKIYNHRKNNKTSYNTAVTTYSKKRENFWILKLRTLHPDGLNQGLSMFKRQNCRTVIFHSKHFINAHLINSETAQDVIMVIYKVKYGRNHNSENFKIL